MKEIRFEYSARGLYEPSGAVSFGDEEQLKLVIAPHDFELKLSGEVLRESACAGYELIVSRRGACCIRDAGGKVLKEAEGTDRDHRQVRFAFENGKLHLSFGSEETVDHYPNCDGEYDRWSQEWVAARTITFSPASAALTVE